MAVDFFPIDTTFYIKPKDELRSIHYLFHVLATLDLPSLAADSAVPGLNRNIAYRSQLLVPPSSVLEAFDRQVSTSAVLRKAHEDESSTLGAIRDTLLPKLVSGDVRVKDAEKLLGTAT